MFCTTVSCKQGLVVSFGLACLQRAVSVEAAMVWLLSVVTSATHCWSGSLSLFSDASSDHCSPEAMAQATHASQDKKILWHGLIHPFAQLHWLTAAAGGASLLLPGRDTSRELHVQSSVAWLVACQARLSCCLRLCVPVMGTREGAAASGCRCWVVLVCCGQGSQPYRLLHYSCSCRR